MTKRCVCAIALLAALILASQPAGAQELPAPAESPSFLQTLKSDFKAVLSKDNVPVLSAATALALLAQPFDETLTYSASCSTFLKTTFEGWARVAGQEWLLATSSLATYAIGRVANQPRVREVGSDLIEAQIVAGTMTFVLKQAVQRTRPDGEPYSFPSGHASGMFAGATVLQRHFGLKAGVPAYTAAVLISGARLQANSHYPTDLIAGAALGILAGRGATFDIGSHRVRLSPAPLAGGMAITGTIH